ncbi:hypothetical protein ACFX2G_039745 [Malus domestica]
MREATVVGFERERADREYSGELGQDSRPGNSSEPELESTLRRDTEGVRRFGQARDTRRLLQSALRRSPISRGHAKSSGPQYLAQQLLGESPRHALLFEASTERLVRQSLALSLR